MRSGIPQLRYGDSLGDEIPAELKAAYTWWVNQHSEENRDAPQVERLSISQQRDGSSCGIFADNALRCFVAPASTQISGTSLGDVVDERLKMFNVVAGHIVRQVHTLIPML
jgi:Ulp1 family protease